MNDITNLENERLIRGMKKIYENFINMSPKTMMIETYKKELYFHACGQSCTYSEGWVKGVEYVMEYLEIDYKELRQQVKEEIISEGREIVNNFWFEEE